MGFWKGFGRPTWRSGSALGVQVGVLGRLWASKLGSLGSFGQPNEAPKESFGSPEALEKHLLTYFCDLMQNLQEPKENMFLLGFSYARSPSESSWTSKLSS